MWKQVGRGRDGSPRQIWEGIGKSRKHSGTQGQGRRVLGQGLDDRCAISKVGWERADVLGRG